MDYSTISNKTNYTEAEELTNGELSERYYLLKKQFDNLSCSYETTKQELHDTKRNYHTALDVQSHLSAELECLQGDQERKKNEVNNRITALQEEISQLREERSETLDRHAVEIKKFVEQIKDLKEEQAIKARVSPDRDNSELEEARAAVNAALEEAAIAKAGLEELKMELVSWRMKTEELVSEIGEMRVAADLRREELRAANDREATALAELAEAKAMLHQYTADSQDLQPHAAKGNSIFAEVEDKRQEMAKNLIQMKQTNSRLRRELANKQVELDALLHEKQTIWEQQAGATAHYDRELIESYEGAHHAAGGRVRASAARARALVREAQRAWNQRLAARVLDHLKSECERLRREVLSRGAAQLASAAQVRELRRKMALHAAAAPPASPPAPACAPPATKPVHNKAATLAGDEVKKKVSFN